MNEKGISRSIALSCGCVKASDGDKKYIQQGKHVFSVKMEFSLWPSQGKRVFAHDNLMWRNFLKNFLNFIYLMCAIDNNYWSVLIYMKKYNFLQIRIIIISKVCVNDKKRVYFIESACLCIIASFIERWKFNRKELYIPRWSYVKVFIEKSLRFVKKNKKLLIVRNRNRRKRRAKCR